MSTTNISPAPTRSIRVGLGVSVLERAMQTDGHLDGIGMYTSELVKYLPTANIAPQRFAFQGRSGLNAGPNVQIMPGSVTVNLLRSAAFGMSFPSPPGFEQQLDLFHAPDHLVPRFRNIPVLASVMDPIPLMHPEWTRVKYQALKNWVLRRTVQSADHFVTISQFVIDDIATHFRIPRERISAVELGVDDAYFETMPEEERQGHLATLGLPPAFLLFIGTLQPRKNVLRLIQAFEQLPVDIQRACPLVVAGREGWSSEPDRAALARLTEKKTGRWLNYVTPRQKMALLQSARALVFPSLYEGFGLPVLEAFASGLPVVASNTTSIPEVAGDAALLVDPLNVEQLTHAMRRIVEDEALHAALTVAGRARAAQFTWSRTAERTAALYQRILA
ncbi:glycosyltransferase family 1 protein [Robbsia sp. KACC 23696]|uniref:glycosyltransferase family 4 protein n=1 Tax=Robbsia sp. KACC 23696 TaxID=3149231 RepID=UPI00325A530E